MKRSPKNLIITFSGERLTHFGGLYLLQRFFQQINLRSLLSQYIRFSQRNNRYTIAKKELLALIYPIALGIGRIEATHFLKQNSVFQYLTGLPAYPDATTLRRFLLRMARVIPKLRKFHDKLLFAMILKPHPPTRIIFDVDSTVLVLYGKQEMALIGYNPKKEGQAILPSASVLQRYDQRLLAWRAPSRQCTYSSRDHRSFGCILCQSAAIREKRFYPRRQRVFRSQDHRISGIEEGFLCHRGKTHKAYQEKALRSVLPGACIRYRDCRVHVSRQGGTQRVSVHRDPSTHPGRPNGSAYPFLNGQVQLSGHCDQYQINAHAPLAVLQWTGLSRAAYQRTQRRLSVGENSDETLRGQRSIFPHSPVFIQPDQLVQAVVSAAGVSEYDA